MAMRCEEKGTFKLPVEVAGFPRNPVNTIVGREFGPQKDAGWVGGKRLDPVPIAPGTFYEPVSPFDSFLVNASPVARHMLSASVVAKNMAAATQLTAQGDTAGAANKLWGAGLAWMGVIAPF